ncbi:MAG TPA: hypothetical protein VGL81_15830 [Polyangiaceae bacterium]|jgi:hypothetical protein
MNRLLLNAAWLLPLVAACASADPSDPASSTASSVTAASKVAQIASPAPRSPETAPGTVSPDEHLPYNGGAIMTGTVHLYYIWYGQWNDDTPASIILPALGGLIGGSPFLNVLSTYKTPAGVQAATQASIVGASEDSGSQGLQLQNATVAGVVSHAITTGALPSDSNGIYVVLGGSNVNFVDFSVGQLCTTMCGYHESTTVNGTAIRYAFVGSPNFCFDTGQAGTSGAPGCAWSSTLAAAKAVAPHGDAPADAMATALAHEIAEAITDPSPGSGFYDPTTGEAADLCEGEWGPTYSVNSSPTELATVSFPTTSGLLPPQNFLLMPLNANLGNGFCAMQLPKAPTCTFAESCVDEKAKMTVTCNGVTGDINSDMVIQRDGVAIFSQEVDKMDPTQPFSATDSPAAGHSYRGCTSNADGNGGLLCSAATTATACPACTPRACKELNCGTMSDGCGGEVTCGGCPAKFTCVENECQLQLPCPKGICQ